MNQKMIDRSVEIARAFGVTKLVLFGSAAESPSAPTSI